LHAEVGEKEVAAVPPDHVGAEPAPGGGGGCVHAHGAQLGGQAGRERGRRRPLCPARTHEALCSLGELASPEVTRAQVATRKRREATRGSFIEVVPVVAHPAATPGEQVLEMVVVELNVSPAFACPTSIN